MGWVARVFSFARLTRRQDAKVPVVKGNPGAGANATMEHFSAAGDDSPPLDGDYVAAMDIPRSGGKVAVGSLDPRTAGISLPGEKRIFARSPDGTQVSQIYMLQDGNILIQNDVGSILITPAGIVVINETLTIDTVGNVITPGTMTASAFIGGGGAPGAPLTLTRGWMTV